MSASTDSTSASCSRRPSSPAEASPTSRMRSPASVSSSVAANASTRPCGSLRMNPTVSVTRYARPSSRNARVVGSSVSKSRSSTRTSEPVRAFRSVDLPTFVYPARATVGIALRVRSRRMTPRRSATALSRALRSATLRRAIRRSDSSWVSPGPRVPTPPPSRSRCCHMPRMRCSEYSSWASSTWSLPSAVWACRAKMSRMTVVRSTTRIWSASSSARCWRGASSSSQATTSASASFTRSRSSSTLPGPRYVFGSGLRRCWVSVATASTVAVRSSSCISASASSLSVPGGREAMMTPRSGVGSRGALRAADT